MAAALEFSRRSQKVKAQDHTCQMYTLVTYYISHRGIDLIGAFYINMSVQQVGLRPSSYDGCYCYKKHLESDRCLTKVIGC